jgi:hypothetical protein
MVVGMGEDPSLGEYEKLLQSMKITASGELVLLHPDRSVAPGSTREWLKVCLVALVKRLRRLKATESTLDTPTPSCRASCEFSIKITQLAR